MSRFWKPLGCVGMMSGVLLLLLPGAARAATVTFNFNACGSSTNTGLSNVSCGSTSTFTSGGFSITATSVTPAANSGTLFAKNDAGDEKGLGLTNDTTHDNEITVGSFIQVDVSSIIGNDPLTIIMNSSTTPDGWAIYQTNTAGVLPGGPAFLTGADESMHNISPSDTFLDFTATDGNVLLHSLSFTTAATPEPSGLALLGTGILGLAGVVRRKLKV